MSERPHSSREQKDCVYGSTVNCNFILFGIFGPKAVSFFLPGKKQQVEEHQFTDRKRDDRPK